MSTQRSTSRPHPSRDFELRIELQIDDAGDRLHQFLNVVRETHEVCQRMARRVEPGSHRHQIAQSLRMH